MRAEKAMKDFLPDDTGLQRALADAPRERTCLRCHTMFWSEGFGQRICKRCKASHSWKNAVPVTRGSSRKS